MTHWRDRAAVRWGGKAALLLAGLGAAWAVRLFLAGGFKVQILGFEVTTNDPLRPLVMAGLLALVFVLTHGIERARRYIEWVRRIDDRLIAGGIAAAVVATGLTFCTMVAASSDPYGYVSQADLWLTGSLKTPQPWAEQVPWPEAARTFAPLAYNPRSNYGIANDPTLVPAYPPGLPLLMALFTWVFDGSAAFAVVPLSGGILVLAVYGLGRKVASSRAGLSAAWLTATSPVFLFMLMWPMSDVPVAAGWVLTFYLMFGASVTHAVAAGLVSAAAILIRPNLVFLLLLPVLWYGVRAWQAGAGERRVQILQLVAFCSTSALGPVAVAVLFARLYGSPLQSGYGDISGFFDRTHVAPNLWNYATWFVESHTWVGVAGLVALGLPLRRLWSSTPSVLAIAIFAAAVAALLAYYAFYLVFDVWWFLRFLLPVLPLVMLGVSVLAVALTRARKPWLTFAVVLGLVLLGLRDVRFAADRFAFYLWEGERRFVVAAANARALTPENSVVFSMLHSGSARYYAGRVTLRFDVLETDWLDRAVAWLAERDVQSYLLADDLEINQFRQRFAGQQTVARLDGVPVFTYTGSQKVYLYQLGGPVPDRRGGRTFVEQYTGPRSASPAPAPTLDFRH
jgi:hypothetical protein